MVTTNCPIPPLYTLRKDHKVTNDPEVGPPVRPVCGAVVGYNRPLSHVISSMLKSVWEEEPDVCLSTEEMMAGIQDVNRRIVSGEMAIGSADVKALYPSLDIEFTVEKVCEVVRDSKMVVSGVDV